MGHSGKEGRGPVSRKPSGEGGGTRRAEERDSNSVEKGSGRRGKPGLPCPSP